jgi:GTPase SAR1 family protein
MSKREQEKAVEVAQRVADETKNAAQTQIRQQQAVAQEFQSTVNRSLDETNENVRKSIDETRSQIPRYTNVVKNYQEQALESTGKMVEEYVEAQKSIINSVFDSVAPFYENVNRMFSTVFSKVQRDGPDRSILQKIFQQQQEHTMISYLETLMLLEMH